MRRAIATGVRIHHGRVVYGRGVAGSVLCGDVPHREAEHVVRAVVGGDGLEAGVGEDGVVRATGAGRPPCLERTFRTN